MNGRKHERHHGGFSLIELLIAISIAGILLAVAVPNLTRYIRDTRITTTSNQFLGALNFARSEAIKRRGIVSICNTPSEPDVDAPSIDDCTEGGSNWTKGWITYFTDPESDETTLLHVAPANKDDITILTNLEDDDLFQFDGRGLLVADVNYRFSVCDERGPEAGRILLVDRSGRSRSIPFDDEDAVDCAVGD